MPRDKTANHIKLMGASRQEFLECGFEKASMRSIGERCGLTAAGIYRHCRDKEDLFDQLVMPFVQRINEWLIVVLDEATAFADPENEALIQKAFVKLTEGRTVIMIAHRLSTVVGADRIIVLDSGHVEEQGTHAELIAADGLYARMWTDYRKAVNWKISSESEVG